MLLTYSFGLIAFLFLSPSSTARCEDPPNPEYPENHVNPVSKR